jgi:hypothetical protein
MTVASLLDANLDDLADLPEFKPFNVGTHRATFKWEEKMVGEHPALVVNLTLLETLEQANAEDAPQEAGAETDVSYMLDNEYGVGNMKELLKQLNTTFGFTNNRDILNAVQGAEVVVTTNIRTNKDKTQKYTNIVTIGLV